MSMNQEVEDMDDASPAEVEGGPEEETVDEGSDDGAPALDDEGGEPPEGAEASDTGASEEAPEDAGASDETPDIAPNSQPSSPKNEIAITGHRRMPPTPQELDNEDALFAQDLQRGHIKPKTMADLYGKKDTLGKIGTLFGLLVAGAGSGLTGQPNAVLEMMKNEINNDFEAQKISNTNAQNWLRLSQQHELQKAQLGQMGIQNEYTKAQMGKIPSEIEANKAHAESAKADAYLKSITAAKTKASLGALKHLQDQVDKMPDGPSKANAQGVLQNQVAPAIQQYNSSENAKTSSQLMARAALRGDLPPPVAPAVDLQKLQLLKKSGEAAAMNGIPLSPGQGMDPQEAHTAMREAGAVTQNRAAYTTIKNAFEQLDAQAVGGALNQEKYGVIKAHVVGQLVSSGIPKDEAHDLASTMLPGWKDIGQTRKTKAMQMWEQFKTKESDTPVLDTYALKAPFPGPPTLRKDAQVAQRDAKRSSAAAGPKKEGLKTKTVNGITYKKTADGWAQ